MFQKKLRFCPNHREWGSFANSTFCKIFPKDNLPWDCSHVMEHKVHERGGGILSMNEVIVVEVFDGQYNLTSGMSFV